MIAKYIQLRPLKDTDAKVIANLANNRKIWLNVRDQMPHPYYESDAIDFINMTKGEDPHITFVIEFKGDFCGMIGLLPQKDVYRKSCEFGYWIGEPYWGKGIATQAVEMILKYGFEQLGFERFYAGVFEHNLGSMRVLEKNGFTKEGISRRAVFKNNEFLDEHRYGKLSSE